MLEQAEIYRPVFEYPLHIRDERHEDFVGIIVLDRYAEPDRRRLGAGRLVAFDDFPAFRQQGSGVERNGLETLRVAGEPKLTVLSDEKVAWLNDRCGHRAISFVLQ